MRYLTITFRSILYEKSNLIIIAFLSSFSLLGIISSNASTLETTPQHPWRYSEKAAWYHDYSTSDYYKKVWDDANAKWSADGFNWKKIDGDSKTTVSTMESTDTDWTGRTWTSNPHGMFIESNEIRLNRTLLASLGYTQAERTYVAEHEMGHALGINHNNVGSISVMNPANRYYTIQQCDINGMEKRYSGSYSPDTLSKSGHVTYDYATDINGQPEKLKDISGVIIEATVNNVSDGPDFYSKLDLSNIKVLKGELNKNIPIYQAGNSNNDTNDSRILVSGEKVIIGLGETDGHYEPSANGQSIFVEKQDKQYTQLSTQQYFDKTSFDL